MANKSGVAGLTLTSRDVPFFHPAGGLLLLKEYGVLSDISIHTGNPDGKIGFRAIPIGNENERDS